MYKPTLINTSEIYKSFDCGYELIGVFLDIPKAFDKVLNDSVMLNLEQNGVSGNLCNILQDFLDNQKQKVSLNGQVCSWANVIAGVP